MSLALLESNPDWSNFGASISRWHISLLTMSPLLYTGATQGNYRPFEERMG
jgi:hypothetical protein